MNKNVLKVDGIEIIIEEVNGLKTINIIQADECNIKYKGNIILENTKEEFSDIPIQIREQVKKCASMPSLDKNEIIFDIDTPKANYFCRTKSIIVDESKECLYMNNWLMSIDVIGEDIVGIDIKKHNHKREELMSQAKERGFTFYETGSGNDYDTLYTLEVPIRGFDIAQIKEFLTLWESYNDELNKIVEN